MMIDERANLSACDKIVSELSEQKAVGVVPRIGRPRSQGSISVRDVFSLKQSNHFFFGRFGDGYSTNKY